MSEKQEEYAKNRHEYVITLGINRALHDISTVEHFSDPKFWSGEDKHKWEHVKQHASKTFDDLTALKDKLKTLIQMREVKDEESTKG